MTQEATQITETPPLPGLQLVQDINKAIQTIATDFAGDVDPAALAWPFCTWAHPAEGTVKRRNSANTQWIVEGHLFLDAGTNHAGPEPTNPVAYMTWADTANGLLKRRDDTNAAWVTLGPLLTNSFRLLRVTLIEASGTFTRLSETRLFEVEGVSGGGCGGGSAGAGSGGAAGSGGGAGQKFHFICDESFVDASVIVTIGLGGQPKAAGNTTEGNAGGTSSFGTLGSATGGFGGAGGDNTTGNSSLEGGAGGTCAYSSDVTPLIPAGSVGASGGVSLVVSGIARFSGNGGSSPYGGGPTGRRFSATGLNGSSGGPGAGGSGGLSGTTSTSGGAGGDGLIIVREYA